MPKEEIPQSVARVSVSPYDAEERTFVLRNFKLRHARKELDRRLIRYALDKKRGDKRHAARFLGISERQLYNLLREHKLM